MACASIKFTHENGRIYVSSMVQGNEVKITVSDSGIGMSENELKNIFDRFYIVDKFRSKEKCGSGLGQSIAKWIVLVYQGTIDVKSEQGKWIKLIVTLKLK